LLGDGTPSPDLKFASFH